MTWLHKFFGLFFIPADGRAKLAQQLISTVLPFHPLYFPCSDIFVVNQMVLRLAEKYASASTLAWSHVASCQICIEVGKMNDPERIHDT